MSAAVQAITAAAIGLPTAAAECDLRRRVEIEGAGQCRAGSGGGAGEAGRGRRRRLGLCRRGGYWRAAIATAAGALRVAIAAAAGLLCARGCVGVAASSLGSGRSSSNARRAGVGCVRLRHRRSGRRRRGTTTATRGGRRRHRGGPVSPCVRGAVGGPRAERGLGRIRRARAATSGRAVGAGRCGRV
jgi:hypothetical protein